MSYETDIINTIKTSLSKYECNIFDDLCVLFRTYVDKPCTNIAQLKKRTEKSKGTCFEIFCMLYLRQKGYECWMLNDLSDDLRKSLNLCKQDVGIDLIAKKNGFYYPIQCKFRKPTKDFKGRQVHRVTWRDLSTFLSLCERTGGKDGWKKNIIMTNADYCCWKGKKSEKDFTIGKKTLMNLPRTFWYEMVYGKEEQPQLTQPIEKKDSRELRQAWLDKLTKK
jgi:predicted helicase